MACTGALQGVALPVRIYADCRMLAAWSTAEAASPRAAGPLWETTKDASEEQVDTHEAQAHAVEGDVQAERIERRQMA
eukprot:5859415-Pyramimonas_sp.AAC.1